MSDESLWDGMTDADGVPLDHDQQAPAPDEWPSPTVPPPYTPPTDQAKPCLLTSKCGTCDYCLSEKDGDPTHWECAKHRAVKLVAVGEQCEVCSAHQGPGDRTVTIAAHDVDEDDEQAGAAVVDIRLPEEFWEQRTFLQHVRAAARSRRSHPDAVLGAVLARVAAMVPPGLKFDSLDDGSEPDGSVNLFCCLLAPSGVGKSRAAATAEKLIVIPTFLSDGGKPDWEKFRCGVGIGSGEGLIEAYMGTTERDTGQVHQAGKFKGDPIVEKVRAQVRHHAFVYVDEGETLNRLLNERRGSTLGGTIRSAFGGGTLGQANASAETTRHLDGGGYALGLLVGYQFGTAAALLKDAGPGTPQRFLWFGAKDRLMSRERTRWPGQFKLPEWVHSTTITFHPDIVQALWDYDVDRHSDRVIVAELDSHAPLMWCKLAALFCLIDGRYTVSLEDWGLAKTVYTSSSQIRAELAAELNRQEEAEKVARREDLAADDQHRKSAGNHVIRVAQTLAAAVKEAGELNWTAYRKNIAGRDRSRYADDALAHAVAMGWVLMNGKSLKPGNYGG